MSFAKQLQLACKRQVRVVVQYERDGTRRQTEPVRVDLVTPDGDAWLVRQSKHANAQIVNASEVTLVHPLIEED